MMIAGFFFLSFLLCLVFLPRQPFYDVFRLPYYWWRVNTSKEKRIASLKLSYGSHPAQYLLHFQVEDAVKPLIFFIHGGGWMFGNAKQFRLHGSVLARQGYPVALINHRKTPKFKGVQLIQDVEDAFDLCMDQLVDRRHGVILGGMSSGGHLAALLFNRKADFPGIKAGFFLAAPLALKKMNVSIPLWLMAGSEKQLSFQQLDPWSNIPENDQRPILLMQSLNDGMVAPENAFEYFHKLRQSGARSGQLICWSGKNHFHPSTWAYDEGRIREDLLRWLDKTCSRD